MTTNLLAAKSPWCWRQKYAIAKIIRQPKKFTSKFINWNIKSRQLLGQILVTYLYFIQGAIKVIACSRSSLNDERGRYVLIWGMPVKLVVLNSMLPHYKLDPMTNSLVRVMLLTLGQNNEIAVILRYQELFQNLIIKLFHYLFNKL